jgi:hypothetical protein
MSVVKAASWVIIDTAWTNPQFLRAIFPGVKDTYPPETQKFEAMLENAFELVEHKGVFEIRRRVDGIDASACFGIADLVGRGDGIFSNIDRRELIPVVNTPSG